MAQFVPLGTVSAPADWVIPGSLSITPVAVHASFDGTAASADYLPTLEIVSDSGHVVGRYVSQVTVAAGVSAEVSWAPFLRTAATAASTSTLAVLCAAHVAAVAVANGGTHTLAFDHFRTSDLTVFGTCTGNGPVTNTAGDTDIKCLKAGLIWWRAIAQWTAALTQVRVSLVGSDDPIGSFTPEHTVTNNTSPLDAPASSAVAQTSYGIYGTANVGDRQSLAAVNVAPDGLSHNINGAMIYGIWLPRAAVGTIY